jgi:predicted TIM-barrel fold metal-dependent hydrolase
MEDRVIIVSCDSHAGVPKELWPEYLPERFHHLLPQLHQDNDQIYPHAIYCIGVKAAGGSQTEVGQAELEHLEAQRENWEGLYDATIRLADMDREGIAAELIYLGDSRLGDMFHNVTGRDYGLDAWEAGAKGWNRYCHDAFGFAPDRLLITGAIGPCVDLDAQVAELQWMADHNFIGVYGPGYLKHPDMPPLSDPYWDPFWATCAETNLTMVVHAGYGTMVGTAFPQIEKIYNDVVAAAGSNELEKMLQHTDAVSDESVQFFFNFLNKNLDSRQPMWQMMLGGVFDRHPDLKLELTEIRLDWIPATLAHLDAIWEKNRDVLPAQRRPSEYWHDNCLAGASFIHKVEVEQRHQLGVDTILFGRDFPHHEATWPQTKSYLADAFQGVPEDEARKMVGENGIRFFGLDRERLAAIAKRIGPTIDEIIGGPSMTEDQIERFAASSGYTKPYEGDEKLTDVDQVLKDDLALFGASL